MGFVIGRIHYGLKVVFCFKHFTAFHYHHHTRPLMSNDHMNMFVECVVEVWLTYCMSFRLPFIFITIYGVVCVQLVHFSIGDWKYMSIAHAIITIKSEVSTFPIVIIFFRGCVSEMFLHHILLLIAYTFQYNREFVFIITVQLIMSAFY